mgnify:FL=1
MKIVRNFNDFVKNKVNEDIDPIQTLPEEITDGEESTQESEIDDQSNLIDDIEEEEEGDQIDKDLNEVAKTLGVSREGNVIKYEGHDIEFYSDPMCFAIDRNIYFKKDGKKTQLRTVEELLNYLDSNVTKVEQTMESRRFKRNRRK